MTRQSVTTDSEMTFAEKMFAKATGKNVVQAGDIVYPDPELIIIHDAYLEAAYRELQKLGYKRVTRPERLMAVTDHEVVYATQKSLERGRANRRIVRDWRVGRFFDAGQGGHGHIFPMEMGIVRPGMFIAAYDMHCSNFGAVGAYALATGPDITVMLATGTMWVEVPETIFVELKGNLAPGVHARDVGFSLSRHLSEGRSGFTAEARVVEFHGNNLDRMSVATRAGIINTLTETDVAHVLFPPMTYDGMPVSALSHLPSRSHAKFAGTLSFDLDSLTPQLALPGAPSNAAEVSVAAGTTIHHAYIGACGSSQYEDFANAAAVMKDRHVAAGVRLLIVPGTVAIAQRMMHDGLTQKFMDAGAIILPPGCGPCAGGLMGQVGSNEVSISTAATNGPGRMGAKDAEYFLGSPLTVAASAVTGRITDPRELLCSS
ncbi:aconitase family protein [Paraburkholderia sp. 22B1P]|uniref:3-isopropylmalate dehydratase large subunit n=1 Tax=Paraburkholderia sp. 22B1P TaxID=3080498 RepID=UPI00308D4BB6|nr:3-isopropylmalate dehydratase large subunit [Paraburkholderia sp. 22B1P]